MNLRTHCDIARSMSDNHKTPTLYTVQEVADTLRVHARTAYRLITNGEIKAVKIGSQWRIPESALNDYIEEGLNRPVREKKGKNTGPGQYYLPIDKE